MKGLLILLVILILLFFKYNISNNHKKKEKENKMFIFKNGYFIIESNQVNKAVNQIHHLIRQNSELMADQEKIMSTKLGIFPWVMKSWGWSVNTDESGNIISVDYFGNDHLIYQKMFFEHIASNIKAGCYINFTVGEINKTWFFDGYKMIEK